MTRHPTAVRIGHIAIALFTVILFAAELQAATYKAFDIGGHEEQVLDLNNKGEFIGKKSFFGIGGFKLKSFVYLPNPAYGLSAGYTILTGPYSDTSTASCVNTVKLVRINDSGVIIGYDSPKCSFIGRMVKWVNGEFFDIDRDDGDFFNGITLPRDINNSGLICGSAQLNYPPDTDMRPFLFDGTSFIDLDPTGRCAGTFRDVGSAISINDAGATIMTILCNGEIPFVVKDGSKTLIPDSTFSPIKINNRNQILGTRTRLKPGTQLNIKDVLSVIYESDGSFTILPRLADTAHRNWANDINDLGQVVGHSDIFLDSSLGFGGFSRGWLWLPEDDYGLQAGIHDLDDLVENALPVTLQRGYLINNAGQMVVGGHRTHASLPTHRFLLTPIKPGLVVNTTSDEPDVSPGDGECFTSFGDCSFRAAIMEANALLGRDTISFDIPGGGIPVIRPNTPLPSITDTVLIDGLTQPGQKFVELDGSLAVAGGTGVDGLTLDADESEIRGLIIHSFSASGIHIVSGTSSFPNVNKLHSNIIGTDVSGLIKKPNLLHGIHASGSFIQIGRENFFSPEKGNVIAYNLGAGVFVDSGISNVRISENNIYGNGQLGIDLFPPGVNGGDSLAEALGANRQAKAPILLNIRNDFFEGRMLRGIFGGRFGSVYRVELFVNDTCDNSGSGEGRAFLTALPGLIGGQIFEIAIPDVDTSILISATVTDDFGNTSEFSLCWPQKSLKLLDANGDSLANKQIVLSRVARDIPTFSDTLVDTLLTNDSGFIDVSKYYWGVHGDTLFSFTRIRLSQVVHTEPSVKHPELDAYKVILDNAEFDSLGGMSYARLNSEAVQEVKMDHTTLEFNLMVSIEWDADLAYIRSLEQGFRNMSNYLYDVSDGQMRLGTVVIFDNALDWKRSDIQIYASNIVWPHVSEIGGIHKPAGFSGAPLEMPRKWFGSEKSTRNGTFNEHPLDMTTPKSYTTFAHEFGHYALSLYDEYVFPDGAVRCGSRTKFVKPYGFMDYQYPDGGAYSSELSSASAYSSAACRNNKHWNTVRQSTWETVELLFQKKHGGILAPMLRPSERTLPTGLDYLPGPNNNLSNLDYDVGALVKFPITHGASLARSLKVRFFREFDPSSAVIPNMLVLLDDTTTDQRAGSLKQGRTSDDGGLWVVGKLPGHQIIASGATQILAISGRRRAAGGRTWFYTGTSAEFADSVVIGLREVQGDKSVISRVQLGASGLTYRLDAPNAFLSAPTIEHQPDGGAATSHTFLNDANGYSVSITDSLAAFGTFRLSAVDDSGAAYFFDADYTTLAMDSGVVTEIKGPRGVSEAKIDNTSNSIEGILLLSTDYPVLRAGLSPSALQGGPAQNLAIFPEQSLPGNNNITIRYSDADLLGGPGALDEEESLRIFHWSADVQQWELVGGSVDTFFNEVTTSIANTGVYAAFTTVTTSPSCCSTPGDANSDGKVNIADVQFVISWLFLGGVSPSCCAEATANGDDKLNIADVTYVIAWLFAGGPDPLCGPSNTGC